MIAGTIPDMMSAVITGITDMTSQAHWHYPGDDPRQPSEMIHRHDHQNHS